MLVYTSIDLLPYLMNQIQLVTKVVVLQLTFAPVIHAHELDQVAHETVI
jgi:hypothetical protein